VEVHDDHFAQDTDDAQWLRVVGDRGWIVLTHNRRIRHVSRETEALMEAGVRAFFLIGHAPHRVLAENFVRTEPRVRRFLARHGRHSFLAKVYRPSSQESDQGKPGRVEMWLSRREWRRQRG
jgi:hypothetical protein